MSNELYHHGRLGQKWGEQNGPPYPLSRSQLSLGGYIQSRKDKKAHKQREQSLKKAREAAEAKRKHDADKERVLKSGTATEVLKYQGELTIKELQDAYNRIDWENKLRGFSQKELESNMKKIDNAMKGLQTATNWVKIGTDTYNTIAKIYNATDEGKKNPFPLIGSSDKKDDKKK